MKKKIISLALLLLPCCFAFAQTGAEWNPWLEQESKACRSFRHHLTGAADRSGGDGQVDITYGRFQWTVTDLVTRHISGRVLYRFNPQMPLNDWTLDLSDALTVSQVKWHGQNLGFDHGSQDLLVLHFPQARPVGVIDSVEIIYAGVPIDSSGFGSFDTTLHAGVPILWTLSEPYGARDWFPCHQDLNDKIDSCDIFITAPAGNRAASNGILVSETTNNGQVTAHWRTRYPIATYLLCMAVTNYEVFSHQVPYGNDTTLILNYIFPENLAEAQTELPIVIQQMQLYDTLFGIYPFTAEKYGQAQFGWGGGMEHQTMTFFINFDFELLGHELAHHWFGDKITCGSWEDIWLNESFATYCSGLCYEHIRPQYWYNFRKQRIKAVISEPGGSVRVNDTTDIKRIFSGRLSYAKGALVLHQLRWIMGDSAFFSGIRAYLNDPALAYGFALTPNLQAHLEQASGLDLDQYLAQWYAGEGFPNYTIVWSQDAGNEAVITLNQTTSMPASVDFFPLPVPVRLYGANGRDTLLVLDHTFSGQTFTASLGFQADSLAFDPDLWLISGTNTVTKLTGTLYPASAPLNSWSVTPNPSPGDLALHLDSRLSGLAQATLYAADGKRLREWPLEVATGSSTFPLRVAGLPAGLYRISLNMKDWQDSRQVILSR